MLDLEQIIGRLVSLEDKYFELQSRYHELIHAYETLKEDHENCTRHRDESETQSDLSMRN